MKKINFCLLAIFTQLVFCSDYHLLKTVEALKKYSKIPSVIAFEQPFILALKTEFKDCGYDVLKEKPFLVLKKGSTPKYILSAHIDRHGVVFNNGEFEYAETFLYQKKHQKRRGNKFLNKVGKRYLNYSPYYSVGGLQLKLGRIRDFDVRDNSIFYKLNTPFTIPENTPLNINPDVDIDIKNELIIGQIDNTLSCAVIRALAQELENVIVFFSVEEEIGNSGPKIAEMLEQLNLKELPLLVLDTTPFNTLEEIQASFVVFRYRDSNATFSPTLNNTIAKIAKSNHIPFIYKDKYLESKGKKIGLTELGHIYKKLPKISGVTIQIPSINYHTPIETATFKSTDRAIDLLGALNEYFNSSGLN
jgi:putative aminopeptidase FrvX